MSTSIPENPKTLSVGTYDVRDVAELLKCSVRHVRNLTDAGKIPGVLRVGRCVRFHRAVVIDWLTAMAKAGSHE